MRTDTEYEELQLQLRNEIGARHGLAQEATEIIPLGHPDIMRAHADRLAKLTGAKPVRQRSVDQDKDDAGDGAPGGKNNLGKAIEKRLTTILDHYYQPPAKRQ